MTEIIFGFQSLHNEMTPLVISNTRYRHTVQSLIKLQFDGLNVEQQQFCMLFGDIWAKFEGHNSSNLDLGQILVQRNTFNGGLVEIHYTIEHDIHSLTLSMYTKIAHSKHYTKIVHSKHYPARTEASDAHLIFNSYLVVEANSKKSFDLLPMMIRLAL